MATINKAQHGLDDRLVNVITKHDRDIRELKSTIQPIGADILKVEQVPGPTFFLQGGPLTLTTGSAGTFVFTITPAGSILTLWNFACTVYIDGTDNTVQFPSGSALTSASRSLRLYQWLDWADSSDISNIRVFKVRLENYDSASHNYYVKVKAYLPQLAGTG